LDISEVEKFDFPRLKN
jgi:hypothetical protein